MLKRSGNELELALALVTQLERLMRLLLRKPAVAKTNAEAEASAAGAPSASPAPASFSCQIAFHVGSLLESMIGLSKLE